MPSLTSIVEGLLEKAKKLDAYVEANGLPYPSFEIDSLATAPAELQDIRDTLANESNDLKKLAQGPVAFVTEIAFNWTENLSLKGIYHFKLAQAVPLDGSASYEEVAKASGLAESFVLRFLRMGMNNNIFDEDSSGRVVHTASSRLLATDPGFGDAVGMLVEDMAPAGPRVIDAMEKFGQEAQEPNQTAFALHNSDMGFYRFLSQHPERARRFGGGMKFYTKHVSFDLRHLLNAYDFSSIDSPETLVVDVGGGQGHVSQYLARHTKNIHFLVQDLPYVVEEGLKGLPSDLQGRIQYESHDLFEPQAVSSPSTIFLMRWVLLNWPDSYCIRILRALIPALKAGTKIFIYEWVLKDKPVKDINRKQGLRIDLVMATLLAGKERNRKAWRSLLEKSDSRFHIEGFRQPPASAQTLVEITWRP